MTRPLRRSCASRRMSGISSEKPVDIYIYANTNDLKDAVLYEPAWVGGQAFPEDNIVIIGVSTDQLDWGKSTEAHELTHVLVGHLTFTCLGFIPTWLNEGLAMYGEGGPQSDRIGSIRPGQVCRPVARPAFAGGRLFRKNPTGRTSRIPNPYSVVNFLIQTYGRDKMTALLDRPA